MNASRSILWALVAVLLAIVSVQCGASYAKRLFATAGAEGVTVLRTVFAALMLGIVWRPWRGGRLSARQWLLVVAFGASLGLMNLMFYLALQRLPQGVTVAIEFIGPFALALALSRRALDLLWIGLAVAGLAVLLPIGRATAGADPLGVAFGLGAGACWALYIVFGRRVARVLPGGRAAALGLVVAALAVLPFGLAQGLAPLFQPTVVLAGLAVAALSSAIPYSLEMVALKRLPTRSFGILMSLEPAVAAVSGVLLLGESLTTWQILAIASVMAASLGSTATAR